MIPVTLMTDEQAAYWSELHPELVVFTAPEDPPGCVPCPAMVTEVVEGGRRFKVVRVPWQLSDEERAQAAEPGATIWLSTWGGLPPHMIELQPANTISRPPSTETPADPEPVKAVEWGPQLERELSDMDRVVTAASVESVLIPTTDGGHTPGVLLTMKARRAGLPDMAPTEIRYLIGASAAVELVTALASAAQQALKDSAGFEVETMDTPGDG